MPKSPSDIFCSTFFYEQPKNLNFFSEKFELDLFYFSLKNSYLSVSAVVICKQILAYTVLIDKSAFFSNP